MISLGPQEQRTRAALSASQGLPTRNDNAVFLTVGEGFSRERGLGFAAHIVLLVGCYPENPP